MASSWRLRQSIIPYFLMSLGLIFMLYLVMIAIEPLIANNRLIPGFNDVLANYESGSFSGRFGWFLRDISEAQFYGAWLPSIGLLGGGILSWFLEKQGKVLFGMKILGGAGRFWDVLLAGMLGLAITNSLYTHPGWSPTFVAYTSMAPSLVLYFGGGWKKVLTSGIISGVTTYPLANFLFLHLAIPLGVAGFTGIALGMGIMVIVMTEICRFLPWMVQPSPIEKSKPINAANPMQEMSSASYYFGRLLSDAGETVFWGTPVAVIGLYSGALLSWVLNPFSLVSGSGRFPIFLLGTTLAIALAVFYWYPRYYQKGYAFTFATVLFSSAILTSYTLTSLGFILTIVVASLVIPFATHFLIDNLSITKRWPPCPTMLLSTGILTGV